MYREEQEGGVWDDKGDGICKVYCGIKKINSIRIDFRIRIYSSKKTVDGQIFDTRGKQFESSIKIYFDIR